MQWISIDHFSLLKSIDPTKSEHFRSVNQIILNEVQLTPVAVSSIKKILSICEIVRIKNCKIVNDFHTNFLQHCQMIKQLYIETSKTDVATIIGSNDDWLLQKYPTLQYLNLNFGYDELPFTKVIKFLEQNSNIKTFAFNAEWITMAYPWNDNSIIMNTKIKLDILSIQINARTNGDRFVNLMNELHAHGFYKELYVYIRDGVRPLDSASIKQMVKFNALVKLYSKEITGRNFTGLSNLKELVTDNAIGRLNMNDVTNALVNIERIKFGVVTLNEMLPFIRRSVKLTKMDIRRINSDETVEVDKLDIVALNNARKQLEGARKLTLYVSENVYLATKWTVNDTNFDLIELKRRESHHWDDEFDW